ncbi:hypothetical protein [Sphingomonas changbaiensis]|uniref:hypothetical protein n=1 Tax=Sphingomonas changbaiensis TaxID=529705 RepID=UPI00061CE06B|nr:hypothetical protein [Sphingomonas changbaiensis]
MGFTRRWLVISLAAALLLTGVRAMFGWFAAGKPIGMAAFGIDLAIVTVTLFIMPLGLAAVNAWMRRRR